MITGALKERDVYTTMEKCNCCNRKKITIKCISCSANFCSGCIQLEIHKCPEIDMKIKKELEIISTRNKKIVSSKL